jgi:hypothetical protein
MEQRIVTWPELLAVLKQYGPVVGILLAYVWWQSRKIDQLLDKNASIYEAEIVRMSQVQDRLLSHLIGVPTSSTSSPTAEQLTLHIDATEKKDIASNI